MYHFVILDCFSKLFRTVSFRTTTGECVAKAFVAHWVMGYVPPCILLFNNDKQFTSRFFQHIRTILGIEKVLTKTYHRGTNNQIEQRNLTIIIGLYHHFEQRPKDWSLKTDVLMFEYNTQIHGVTNCTPFELMLSQPPKTLITQPDLEDIFGMTRGLYIHRWKL